MRNIRQSDEDTAAEVLNIARNVQNASRIVQRVATVIKNRKTVNSQRSGQQKNLMAICCSSGAPQHPRNAGRTPKKLMKKNYATKRNNRIAKIIALPKIGKEGQEVCSEGAKQVILMHIALWRSNTFWTRSSNDFTNCLINSRVFSFLRFYHSFLYSRISVFTFGHSSKFVWPLWAHKKGTMCAVKS